MLLLLPLFFLYSCDSLSKTIIKTDLYEKFNDIDTITLHDFNALPEASVQELSRVAHSEIEASGFKRFVPYIKHRPGFLLFSKGTLLSLCSLKNSNEKIRIVFVYNQYFLLIAGIDGVFHIDDSKTKEWIEYINEIVKENLVPARRNYGHF